MNGSNAPAVVPAHCGALVPLLGADQEVIDFFAGVADLDATDPADQELDDGVRLASGARLEQFARAGSGDAFCFVGEGGEERPVVYVSLDGEAWATRPWAARVGAAVSGGTVVAGCSRTDGRRTPGRSRRVPGGHAGS